MYDTLTLILLSARIIVDTGIDFACSIALLGDKTGVICGDETDIRKIKSYGLQTGTELKCLTLKDAVGLAEVKFGQTPAIAVSHL